MDKVLCWVCILLCALGLVWPVMRIEECVHAAGREALHDTLRAQELLAGLYRDPRFEESIGRGASAPIRFEEDALADAARERFGEDLVLTVLVTERYLRIDRGAGLGPPLYYWDEKDGVLRWFRRGLDLCQRDGQIVACEPAERKAAIARIEEGLGLGRSDMTSGLRLFLRRTYRIPVVGRTLELESVRETRIFLKKSNTE